MPGIIRKRLPVFLFPVTKTVCSSTGHDWAHVFAEVFQDDPGLQQIHFESEEDRFCVASKNPYLLKRMGYAFKELCENEPAFQEVVDKVLHRIQEERMLCF